MRHAIQTLTILTMTLPVGYALSVEPPKEFTNNIGMKFKLIPAGEFMMGSSESPEDLAKTSHSLTPEYFRCERPRHTVRITRAFFIGVTEVTQEQYEEIMGVNPSWFSHTGKGADKVKRMDTSKFPVETVSWDDAVGFCRRISEQEHRTYRLPTEAEWEYACRAGTTTKWCCGDDKKCLSKYACYEDNSEGTSRPVAQLKPNPWGLYDLHGNVWEWCSDWWETKYYANSPTDDPTGPKIGTVQVVRGGSWAYPALHCRSAQRGRFMPRHHEHGLTFGFRVVLEVPSNR